MKNAIILHGMPTKEEYFDPNMPSLSNAHWLPWLQAQLMKQGIKADTPEVPDSYNPKWDTWVKEVERFEIGPETILVGHSCGSGFWVKYMSLHPELRVAKVVLVAPWMDPDGDETEGFFEGFSIDTNVLERSGAFTIFHSDNDMGNVQKTVARLREVLPDAAYREFHKYGHFTYEDMHTVEFPELLEAVQS